MSDGEEARSVIRREEAACELFGSRWEVSQLHALDRDLFDRIEDQQRMYEEAKEEGDEEAIQIHGEAMIRGWQIALKRMEGEEIGRALSFWPGAKVIAIRPKS